MFGVNIFRKIILIDEYCLLGCEDLWKLATFRTNMVLIHGRKGLFYNEDKKQNILT